MININKLKKKIIKKIYSLRVLGSTFHALTLDRYPSLNLYSYNARYVTKKGITKQSINLVEKFIEFVRTFFWIDVAKRSKYTSYCYSNSNHDELNIYEKRILEKGFVEIENFLSQKSHKDLLKDIMLLRKKSLENSDKVNDINFFTHYENKGLEKKLNKVVENFIPKSAKTRAIYNNFVNFDGRDKIILGNNNWHADRFIPSLKALYFPNGCNWMPFQRIEVSPYEYQNLFSVEENKCYYEKLPDKFKNYDIYSSMTNPNTLVIGFHQILHRRSTVESPGDREVIFLDWAKSFNYLDLVLGCFLRK